MESIYLPDTTVVLKENSKEAAREQMHDVLDNIYVENAWPQFVAKHQPHHADQEQHHPQDLRVPFEPPRV